MQFNITFKTIFEYVLKKIVLCIQIRFVSTEKTTRIASRASCNTITQSKLKFSEKIKLLGHSENIAEKNDVLKNIFRYLIPLIWMI